MEKEKKYWTLTRAIEEANKIGVEVSKPTLIKWILTHHFGHQLGGPGGKWYVQPENFKRFINGKIQKANDYAS